MPTWTISEELARGDEAGSFSCGKGLLHKDQGEFINGISLPTDLLGF